MRAYILRRLLLGLLIIWGVYTLTFFAVNLAPGDPFANLENPKMQKEDLDRLRAKWGYDQPILVRYVTQLRRMFWADREVLTYEAKGLAFDVSAGPGGNAVRGRPQKPPNVLTLVPTETSALDGATEVRLERVGETWGPVDAQVGSYLVDRKRYTLREDGSSAVLETQGLTIEASGGVVRARRTLTEPPPAIVLVRDDGVVAIPRGEDGSYGPVVLDADRYRYEGVDVLVPTDPLQRPGPTFDLGKSVQHKENVTSYLKAPLVNTLILAGAALLLYFAIGVFVGVIQAVRPNSKMDHALTLGSLFVYCMPGFWLALMLVLTFSVRLQWLPSHGMHSPGEDGLLDLLRHMVLPVFVLGIAPAASTARYQRSALIEVMNQDYIRTARAKGLGEQKIVWKHAMRNSLLPVITLIGLSLPFLVSGAVITETIFAWPGMGSAVISAIAARDVFVITGITFISTTMVIIGNLLADVLYAFADPRVRLQ